MPNDYRMRIYNSYVTGRQRELAPTNLEGLRPRIPSLKKLVRHHFPLDRNALILDLGCGHGALIYVARETGYCNIRGVDGSPEQVTAAKNLGIEGVLFGNAFDALGKEEDSSLDCLICFDLIEHFTKDELIPFVDSIHRVLKPEGRWIIHTANAESPFGMCSRYGDFTHEQAFTRGSLSQLVLCSGFSKIDFFEDQPIPHGLKSMGRWLIWKCFRNLLRLYIAAETGDTGREAIFSQNFLAIARK